MSRPTSTPYGGRIPFLSAVLATTCALVCGAAPALDENGAADDAASGAADAAISAPQSGREALRRAVSIFPVEPLSLFGSLIVRKPSGTLVRELPFSMELNWGASPSTAKYTIMDSFGRDLAVANVTRSADGVSSIACFDGSGAPMPPQPLSSSVFGTDISWLDLTFAYMWWEDAELLEPAGYKGSLCDVVEARPPAPVEGCEFVRLWIDRKHGFLRQAEQFDASGERVRWMWVASVGKINDRWMIRNLEVKRPGTGFQTKLHIDDLDQP